jgi:3'(2'), 5'-bisphosphate nucleotidase
MSPIEGQSSSHSTDAELAGQLASRAGELLLRLRAETGFDDPGSLRKAGDRQSHELLMAALHDARPDDAVLSEEGSDDRSRLEADRLWIVDPLDGTHEYGEEGRTDWAVHVALWERSAGGLTAGAVALPAREMTLTTAGGWPSRGDAADPIRIAVSRTRRPEWFDGLADRVGGVATPIGSAGMKAMSVVLGEADAYLHSGRMKEWDSAAPAAVAAASGLHVSRLDGRPLDFNTAERLTLDLLICRPELADRLLAAAEGLAGTDATDR